jgi:hypothetical protein
MATIEKSLDQVVPLVLEATEGAKALFSEENLKHVRLSEKTPVSESLPYGLSIPRRLRGKLRVARRRLDRDILEPLR